MTRRHRVIAFTTVAIFAGFVGLAYVVQSNAFLRRESGPTEFDGWWKVPDGQLDRVIDEIASSYLAGGSVGFASFSEDEMNRKVEEYTANPLLYLKKQTRGEIERCLLFFGPGIDGKAQHFEYRPNGTLYVKLQWIDWTRESVGSIQTYHFSRKLYRWERAGDAVFLHERFPVPLPLERLADQSRKPESRVEPIPMNVE